MTILSLKLAVSIPDTVLEEKESPRDKTAKLGLIARACAIYGVDVVEVFPDPGGRGEGEEIVRVLEYLETPQYLRKRLYPLDESLRYAGVLPPIRIPSHKPRVPFGSVRAGEVREGVTNGDGTVDIGLEVSPRIEDGIPAGRRVTVKVTSLKPPIARVIQKEEAGEYWGYRVEKRSLSQVLDDPRFDVKVATSRLGAPLSQKLMELREAVRKAVGVKLVFGSPSRGLFEIAGRELGAKVDFVINLFPQQHVETVRTEEAIFAGLGLVSNISAEKA